MLQKNFLGWSSNTWYKKNKLNIVMKIGSKKSYLELIWACIDTQGWHYQSFEWEQSRVSIGN